MNDPPALNPSEDQEQDNQEQDEETHDSEDTSTESVYVTRSGRRSNPPDRLIDGGTYLTSRNKITRRQVHINQDKKTEVNLPPSVQE